VGGGTGILRNVIRESLVRGYEWIIFETAGAGVVIKNICLI
jgi:hypothetical protein